MPNTDQNFSVVYRVRHVVASHLHHSMDVVTTSSNLVEELGADSLDRVEIVMAIEDEFSIVIEDTYAETIHVVMDIVDIVNKVYVPS